MDTSSSHDQIAKKLQDMGAMLEMQARKLHDDGNEGGALSRDQQELHDAVDALAAKSENYDYEIDYEYEGGIINDNVCKNEVSLGMVIQPTEF